MNEHGSKFPHLVAQPDEVDIHRLWEEVGKLALGGKLPLRAAQRMCRMMIVASSSRRNHDVKTNVAKELRVSRRVARGLLEEWSEQDEGRGLLGGLRPELLGESDDCTTR